MNPRLQDELDAFNYDPSTEPDEDVDESLEPDEPEEQLDDDAPICTACSGSGEGRYEGYTCLSCGGSGLDRS